MPKPLDVTSTSAFIEALGSDDDPIIGMQFGVAPNTVAYHRKKRGIPAWRTVRRAMVKKLIAGGQHNDAQIKAVTGMDRRAIGKLRAKMSSTSPYVSQTAKNEKAVWAYRKQHPHAPAKEVAEAVGMSVSGVYAILARG